MIIYTKLEKLLKRRDMTWKDLTKCGISINTPTKFSQNRTLNTDVLDKVCTYLQVQPADIMEWISDEEYLRQIENKQDTQKKTIEKQIKYLQEKIEKI